ncbi:phage tail tape measure protein [Oceanobacillus sp. J11TS1]|uniref:phage tail tape measure protein n=1 Tax=Oceanobacillus sp. J11TS1 TaxID=2807191 RepID=UPI001BB45284|nr:phage tail tape measure protein [Oceanobacillus sp. J11TS1]
MRTRLSWEDDGANRSLEGFKRDLKGLRSEMRLAQSGGKDYTNSLKGMREQSDILTRRFKTQQEQVRELKRRYDEAKAVKGEDAVQTQNLAAQYNRAAAEMNLTEQQLKNLNEELRRQESPWTKVGEQMTNAGNKMQDFGRGMTDFGKSYTMRVTAPIVAGGTAMLKAAIDYESAFAGVRKTVDMGEEGYAKLSRGIRDMAKELPASAVEIAAVAESAGQLGIENDSILGFTRTIIDLGEATNMTTEQAATEFARFANIVGMPQDAFDRLGSSVVELGNNMATTESEIVSMGMRLAAQGSQVGMSEAQIMALAATMSSLGIEAEAGGTAMTTVLKKIDAAVDEGGESLQGFAKASGTSSKEFADAWKNDPISALDLFINGLSDSSDEGANLTSILTDLGIKGIRESDTILRLAGASDLLSEAVDQSSAAWEENSALSDEAAQRYATTESQIKILWNRLKDIAITMGDALIPALMGALDAAEPLIEKIESGAESFANMDEEQQRTILGLIALAAAVGPASVVLGNLTTAFGGVLKLGGSVATMIGKSGGAGLAGSIGLLGKAGVVGLAIAGVGALSLAIYDFYKDSKKAEEVNLDLAESISNQAVELQNSADTFDKLTEKAKISNEELALMNDLNKRIAESSNPGEIQALQEQYDKLAEKSGLSKEELEKLWSANEEIINQSPEVQSSVSETGNKFAENTDAVREYINTLHEATLIELEGERTKALEQEKQIRDDITQAQNELNGLLETMTLYTDAHNMSEQEIADRRKEINELYRDTNLSAEEKARLAQEETALMDIQDGKYVEAIAHIQEQIQGKRDSIAQSEEELAKINELNEQMANLVLQQVGINEQGAKGLEQLDQSIAKNQEELASLDAKLEANGSLSQEEQARYDKLSETVGKQQEAKDYIYEEIGMYSDINSLVQGKLDLLGEEGNKHKNNLNMLEGINVEEGNILDQIKTKNEKLAEERSNLIENLKQQGATTDEINDQVSSIDNKISNNDSVLRQVLEETGLWNEVKDKIDMGADAIEGQGYGIDSNNDKTQTGIRLEEQRTAEAGKDVDKDVNAKDNGTVRAIDLAGMSGVIKPVEANDYGTLDRLHVRAQLRAGKPVKVDDYGSIASLNRRASSPVTKTINLVANAAKGIVGAIAGYAKGTPTGGHKGGSFLAGEEGWELGRMGNRWEMLNFGLYDRPRGYEVFTHDESKKIVRALNNMQKPTVPGYATGARQPGEAERTLNTINESVANTGTVISLLKDIANGVKQGQVIVMDGHTVGKAVSPTVNQELSNIGNRQKAAWGG